MRVMATPNNKVSQLVSVTISTFFSLQECHAFHAEDPKNMRIVFSFQQV